MHALDDQNFPSTLGEEKHFSFTACICQWRIGMGVLEVVGLAWGLVGLLLAFLADRGLFWGDVEDGG